MTQADKYQHKVKITCGLWDSYKDFRKKYKLIYPDVTRKNYVDVCHLLNVMLSDKIIKESFEFKMPGKLGSLSIKKSKMRISVKDGKLEKHKLIKDWKKTWEYWHQEYPDLTRKEINMIKNKVAIYNMNEHTNGYVMRWKWDKCTCNIPNHTVYQFRPTKRNRLELAAWIKSDERVNDYYLDKHHGSKNYSELLKREQREKRKAELEEVSN
jgi:hypothetical protein